MARFLRLDDIRLKPRVSTPIPPPKREHTFYCEQCEKYHYEYSNVGNDHRDYKLARKS